MRSYKRYTVRLYVILVFAVGILSSTGSSLAADDAVTDIKPPRLVPIVRETPARLVDQQWLEIAQAPAFSAPRSNAVIPLEPDCKDCGCKDCCKRVKFQKLCHKPVLETVCVDVYVPEESTVPYCKVKCIDGECVEILGTKTVRRFVKRKKEVTIELMKPYFEWHEDIKCLKCGVIIKNCPDPHRGVQPHSH